MTVPTAIAVLLCGGIHSHYYYCVTVLTATAIYCVNFLAAPAVYWSVRVGHCVAVATVVADYCVAN